jgi:vancomycin resistance protein YoaR
MMESTQSIHRPERNISRYLLRASVAFGSALAVLAVGGMLLLLGIRLVYNQRAYPGISLAGNPLGGKNQEQIVQALEPQFPYPINGTIIFSDGDQNWMFTPADLGVNIDLEAMARSALDIGRQGGFFQRVDGQLRAWYRGITLPVLVRFDKIVAGHTLQIIADQIDRPVVEAALTIEGTEVHAAKGQIGREIDIDATLAQLESPVHQMRDALIPLTIVESTPSVLDAAPAAARAQALLRQPLQLTAEGADSVVIPPATLAGMLRFDVVEGSSGGEYAIRIDSAQLRALLEPRAPEFERKPENARFIFNDETRQLDPLAPAVIGRTLDVDASITAVNEGLNSGQASIPLAFVYESPEVGDDATAEQLGISEAVSVVSTYFYGSSSGRVQNIKTASSAFHGLLIPPGGTLSMADVLGDISLDTGYAEALIIYGDRTISGVGGGVCQVSTTLFRAVFFGGYEIVERHPHAYRVGYYEQGPGSPGPGLDATVFVPLVDFKFRNDTPYWLLMETYIYGNQLLWKFYSTSDGRSVSWSSKTSNEVDAPKPLYKLNRDLPDGKIKQIDYEADGMDVVVYRTVTRDGEALHQDVIKTHYLPWRAIYEFGKGAEIPDDVEVQKD